MFYLTKVSVSAILHLTANAEEGRSGSQRQNRTDVLCRRLM